jgi:N-methylhydantoinase B/oxoprolinase/acetone carboxylase alpha subunit
MVKLSGGGAGVGDPWERPVDKVVTDVRREMVSIEAARLIYGVVIDPATLELDQEATRQLRAKKPAQRYEAVLNEQTFDIELKPVGEQRE